MGSKPSNKLTLHVCGPFRLVTSAGVSLAPRSAKSQGLLALLATSPNQARTRPWIQDKLWSDRGKEQGGASLRQCLSEIRRALGPAAGSLISDRRAVSLCQENVDVVDAPDEGAFLEGIDARDPEFEDWLTIERSKRDREVSRPVAPRLGLSSGESRASIILLRRPQMQPDPSLRLFGEVFVDTIVRSLKDALAVEVRMEEPGGARSSSPDATIGHDIIRADAKTLILRAYADDGRSGSRIWAGNQVVPMDGGLPKNHIELLSMSNQLIEAVGDHFLRRARTTPGGQKLDVALGLALRHVFSMKDGGFRNGDRILANLSDEHASPLIPAWRAHLRAIALVERQADDADVYREEARAFVEMALPDSYNNSVALAALANSRLIAQGDVSACDELSKQAVRLNAATPLGWWSRSAAHLYSGQYDKAYAAADRAARLTGPSPFKFWWDFQRGLTSAMTGQIDKATDHIGRAEINCPTFRPALRYLTALHALQSSEHQARLMANKLTRLEPDFTPERLARDPTYPASLMQKAGLVPENIAKIIS